MALASIRTRPAPRSSSDLGGCRLAVLARIACEGGATRAELARDLNGILSKRTSAAGLRGLVESEIKALADQALIAESRGRLTATIHGTEALAVELGPKSLPAHWSEMRDIRLVARALDIEGDAARLRALVRPDQLRAYVLAKVYGFKLRRAASAAQVRSRLADVALERAFGNRIKSDLGSRAGLSARTARVLAGQLLSRPRDVGTDSRLITLLAAEQSGSSRTDTDALRLAVLRSYFGHAPVEGSDPAASPVVARRPAAGPDLPAARRPDLAGFVREVQGAARVRADGWPGNRKAFICHVWQSVAERHPDWGLSEIEFKAMLTEAHRTGHLVLAGADLKDKNHLKEFQASAIAYKNMVWHFVRVDD